VEVKGREGWRWIEGKCDTETEVEDAARVWCVIERIYIGVIGVKMFKVVSVPLHTSIANSKYRTYIHINPTHQRKNEHVQPPSRAQDPSGLPSTPRPERRGQGLSPLSRWHVPRFQMGR
jgi:hypothetical protein